MLALRSLHITRRISGRHILRARILLGYHFTLISHNAVRWSRVVSVDLKGDILSLGVSLNINRNVLIIDKTQILVIACNRRIHGWLHIAYDHGMIRALRDLKLCQNDRIVQCRRYLTHTAAVGFDRLPILVGTCQFISVCRIQRSDRFIDGKFLARIKQRTIDLAGCIGDVVTAVLTGILVIRRIASHHIRDLLQIFLAAARLHHFRHELDLGVATVPLTADIVLDRRNGILHVNLDALLALDDFKRTVLTNQTIIHSLLVQLRRFPGKDGCHRFGIHIQ